MTFGSYPAVSPFLQTDTLFARSIACAIALGHWIKTHCGNGAAYPLSMQYCVWTESGLYFCLCQLLVICRTSYWRINKGLILSSFKVGDQWEWFKLKDPSKRTSLYRKTRENGSRPSWKTGPWERLKIERPGRMDEDGRPSGCELWILVGMSQDARQVRMSKNEHQLNENVSKWSMS